MTQGKSNKQLKRKNYIIFFVLVGIALLIPTILAFFSPNNILSHNQHIAITPTPARVVSDVTDELTQKEYNAIRDKLVQLVDQQDPRAALSYLNTELNIDPKVLLSCHALTHEIGNEAYRKYKDFTTAVSYQDDLCGSGYLHGVIEETFASTKDLIQSLKTICAPYGDSGKCYHGVGHGLMYYTGNNLPLSLSLCTDYVPSSEKIYCSEGVFMENFNSDIRFHPSRYLKPSDPFYPCQYQTDLYKDSCYFYASDYYLYLHPHDYIGAINWCNTAESGFVLTCLTGIGSRTIKQNIGSPGFVETVCMHGKTQGQINACIDGMVSYFLVNYDSVSRANELCSELKKENQPTCYTSVNSRSTLFLN